MRPGFHPTLLYIKSRLQNPETGADIENRNEGMDTEKKNNPKPLHIWKKPQKPEKWRLSDTEECLIYECFSWKNKTFLWQILQSITDTSEELTAIYTATRQREPFVTFSRVSKGKRV